MIDWYLCKARYLTGRRHRYRRLATVKFSDLTFQKSIMNRRIFLRQSSHKCSLSRLSVVSSYCTALWKITILLPTTGLRAIKLPCWLTISNLRKSSFCDRFRIALANLSCLRELNSYQGWPTVTISLLVKKLVSMASTNFWGYSRVNPTSSSWIAAIKVCSGVSSGSTGGAISTLLGLEGDFNSGGVSMVSGGISTISEDGLNYSQIGWLWWQFCLLGFKIYV